MESGHKEHKEFPFFILFSDHHQSPFLLPLYHPLMMIPLVGRKREMDGWMDGWRDAMEPETT